ncbi:MAG: hypothetical protein M3Z32_02470 [Acidobacteriota bacterium]|nr:hypothetical protein [Acidobacteriota bacterium]
MQPLMDIPPHLLTDVYWSFAQPVPASPEALIDAAATYATDIEASNPESVLRKRLPFADLMVRYSHWVRESGGKWQEREVEHHVIGATGGLTGAELLWEIHVACNATTGQGDHHFFEGLDRVRDGTSDKPVFRVALGS